MLIDLTLAGTENFEDWKDMLNVQGVDVTVRGQHLTKNYRASYSVEGALQASNKNIADAVNSVLTDTIADMSQDTSVHDFIKQNAR